MKRKAYDWQAIRAAYAVGGPLASFRALARRFGPSHVAIRARAINEAWTQQVEQEIRAATEAELTGQTTTANDAAKAEAIAGEAKRRADLIKRHREEWNAVRERIYTGLAAHKAATPEAETAEAYALVRARRAHALDTIKTAKVAAEALGLTQVGERRAYNIGADEGGDTGPKRVIVEILGDPYAEPGDTDRAAAPAAAETAD